MLRGILQSLGHGAFAAQTIRRHANYVHVGVQRSHLPHYQTTIEPPSPPPSLTYTHARERGFISLHGGEVVRYLQESLYGREVVGGMVQREILL